MQLTQENILEEINSYLQLLATEASKPNATYDQISDYRVASYHMYSLLQEIALLKAAID